MTTSNRGDQHREAPAHTAPRHLAATPHDAGLPSDAELTRVVNQMYGGPFGGFSGGADVPTTADQPGASGAPLQHGMHRESATSLGVAEDRQVHALLHRQHGVPFSPSPAHDSGGSDGGYGKSFAYAPSSASPLLKGDGLAHSVGVRESKPPQADPPLLGSGTTPTAIGLEPGRAQTLPYPHSAAAQLGNQPAPSLPTGGLPSPNHGPQLPGHSRGGFGRPMPTSPEGVLTQNLPGTSRGAQSGFISPQGFQAGSGAPTSPLAATPLNIDVIDGFQSEEERILAYLPTCMARAANMVGQLPASDVGYGRRGDVPGAAGAPLGADDFYFLRRPPVQGGRGEAAAASTTTRPPGVAPNPAEELWAGRRVFNIEAIRNDFPILRERVQGQPLVWLDNAATTQKPTPVIQRLVQFYEHENSNIHRAAHELAARSTDAYEEARQTVARFLNAASPSEIVFVRGATEAINLVAQSWGRQHVGQGDEILITHLEHHANIVPWQHLASEKGATLRVAPVDDSGQVRLDEFQRLMTRRTRIVAFPQVSNALGTVAPAGEMVEIAHRYGAKVLIDGAQSIAHMPTDVQGLDADWYVFSGHKVFGPTGIGVLYGKEDLLNATLPWQGGGNMIQEVYFEKSSYQPAPNRFEAGTGNIADAVGLGAALRYLESLGMHNVNRYEHELLEYGTDLLRRINGLKLIGTAAEKASVMSFVLANRSNDEVGKILNSHGIAVRTGHHCAQPILRRFGLDSTVRPSLALYNTRGELDLLADVLRQIQTGRV
jgi:SufS family cysteine desulfurase